MNLKDYYREIAAQEAAIEESFVLIISLQTPNGGRAGIPSEVNRATAAKLVVDKQARLATPEEVKKLRDEREEQQRQRDIAALQERVRMTRLAEDELRSLKKALQPSRKGE
jgi:hypothetical protein